MKKVVRGGASQAKEAGEATWINEGLCLSRLKVKLRHLKVAECLLQTRFPSSLFVAHEVSAV